jgi:hypothetical protein
MGWVGDTGSVSRAGDPVPATFAFGDRVALAYYYIWFTPGWWDGSEGNAGQALEDIHPRVGRYFSGDEKVIDQHMKWARQARLDALAVSWWHDDSAGGMNERLAKVYAGAARQGMKLALLLEAEPMGPRAIKRSLEYFFDGYGGHPATLRVDGLPVVIVWGAWKQDPAAWASLFESLEKRGQRGFFLVSGQTDPAYLTAFRCLESYSTVDVPEDRLVPFFQKRRQSIDVWNRDHSQRPAQWHATIMPGYDERKIPGRTETPDGAGWVERGQGAYYRRCFDAAMASKPDWLRITSFNELAEHSHIEPMEEFGSMYIDLTAAFVEEFKKSGR